MFFHLLHLEQRLFVLLVCKREYLVSIWSLSLQNTSLKDACLRGLYKIVVRSQNATGLKYRGDGIRTHGGIAPTQPFQDCTLNLSDTPLCL